MWHGLDRREDRGRATSPTSFNTSDRRRILHVMQTRSPITGDSRFAKTRRRFDADRTPRELTFSTYKRFPFLSRDRVRHWFADALQAARSNHAVDVWAYVLMPDHVHLLVAPKDDSVKIGRFGGRMKERVSRQAIAWLSKNEPAWLEKTDRHESHSSHTSLLATGRRLRSQRHQRKHLGSDDRLYSRQPRASRFGRAADGLGVVQRSLVCGSEERTDRDGRHTSDGNERE